MKLMRDLRREEKARFGLFMYFVKIWVENLVLYYVKNKSCN